MKKGFKYIATILAGITILFLIWDLLLTWGVYSYFFGYFQNHLNLNVWLIKIITGLTITVFIIYVYPALKQVLFRPLKSQQKKKKYWLIITTFYSLLFFFTYLSEKDRRFDKGGNPITCVAWAVDHYEEVSCNESTHPKYGTPTIKVTKDIANFLSLKIIRVTRKTNFFDPISGKPIVYFSKTGSEYEFFNTYGINPHTGEKLRPITKEVINDYLKSPNESWGLESKVDSLENELLNY